MYYPLTKKTLKGLYIRNNLINQTRYNHSYSLVIFDFNNTLNPRLLLSRFSILLSDPTNNPPRSESTKKKEKGKMKNKIL